jgi:hypothetical protein
MLPHPLAEVRARLEEAVAALPGDPATATPQDIYDQYEMLAIEILDSEFDQFEDGLLEHHLQTFLLLKRLELGIKDG